MLSWADELEKQYAQTVPSGPKSTLVKRGAKDRAADSGDGSEHASKKVKTESGSEGVEDEVRLHYQKGTLSKVRKPLHHKIFLGSIS